MTGREVIERVTGNPSIAQTIYDAGYVCVPRTPTDGMIYQAHNDALQEDARGVWETMIAVSEGIIPEDRIRD